jgi:hypothetical protein
LKLTRSLDVFAVSFPQAWSHGLKLTSKLLDGKLFSSGCPPETTIFTMSVSYFADIDGASLTPGCIAYGRMAETDRVHLPGWSREGVRTALDVYSHPLWAELHHVPVPVTLVIPLASSSLPCLRFASLNPKQRKQQQS